MSGKAETVRVDGGKGAASPVLDVERVSDLERAIAAAGTSLAELMDRAGAAVADAVLAAFPAPSRVAVLAGSGNNGGDGWVSAERLARAGCDVSLTCVRRAADLRAEPCRETALAVAQRARREPCALRILEAPTPDEIASLLEGVDVVVDALLGTGFSGESLRSPIDEWVRAVNAAHARGAYVVAADAPSGLSAQTGRAASPTVEADETVTMLALKPGLLATEAAPFVGALSCAPLGTDIVRDFPSFA